MAVPGLGLGLVLSILVLLRPCVAALACESLGLCSVGKVKPILQDISSTQGLKAALNARAYKNEVFTAVSSLAKFGQFMQLYWNLYHLGYENIMLISYNKKECENILHHTPYLGGCVYDGVDLGRHLTGHRLLWHIRYRTLARIARLGHNAWALDTDIYFFHDPYPFLKAPPFSNMTVLHQAECVWDNAEWRHVWDPNGGFVYVQNVKPNGVAAWYLTEITYRPLRWIDDDWKWMTSQKINDGCAMLDQDTMADIMPSLVSGAPMFLHSMAFCYQEREKTPFLGNMHASRNEGMAKHSKMTSQPVPPAWQPIVGANSTELKYFEMQMPNVGRGRYPDRNGLNLYPPTKGQYSEGFLKLLAEDCPTCGFWPAADDPARLAEAEKVPVENLMFFPAWFVLGWWARGRYGYWDMVPPQQIVGHMNYNPAAHGKYHKLIGIMGMDKWNWTMHHSLAGDAVFQANHHLHRMTPNSEPPKLPPLMLLGFAPTIDFSKMDDERDLQQLLKGLVQVALLTGRTILWPDIPCSSSQWMKTSPDADVSIPRKLTAAFFPWGGPLGKQDCMWWGYSTEPCSSNMRGIVMPEFVEYKRMYAGKPNIEAGAGNTVLRWPGANTAARLLKSVVQLKAEEVKAALTAPPYATHQVLYLGNPVILAGMDSNTQSLFDDMQQSCVVLQHAYIANGRKMDEAAYTPVVGQLRPDLTISV